MCFIEIQDIFYVYIFDNILISSEMNGNEFENSPRANSFVNFSIFDSVTPRALPLDPTAADNVPSMR